MAPSKSASAPSATDPAPDPAANIQSLLRLLTQTAKIPLPTALKLAAPLQAATLTPESLASTPPARIQSAIQAAAPEDPAKLSRQIASAAKRLHKNGPATPSSASKKRKRGLDSAAPPPSLPEPILDEETLRATTVHTNRAPLLLAFATVLLSHTRPAQPPASRLSIAQGMVSAGARARARDLGIADARAADAHGFRRVRVMGSDIAVLRRDDGGDADAETDPATGEQAGAAKSARTEGNAAADAQEPAYWAVDLAALAAAPASSTALPMHTPHGAHAYLAGAFAGTDGSGGAAAKTSPAEREANLAKVLGALRLLVDSWAGTLSADEMDRRAWGWYVAVRPAVAEGKAGWGGKGDVPLAKILDLRRK